VIVVGSVVDMGGNGGDPLLFYGGRYRRLEEAPSADRLGNAGRCARPERVAR